MPFSLLLPAFATPGEMSKKIGRSMNDMGTETGYSLGQFQHEKGGKMLHFTFDFSAFSDSWSLFQNSRAR